MQSGNDILAWARKHLGDKYVFGALTPVAAVDPHVFDCSKFASCAVYQAAGIIYGCDQDQDPKHAYGGTIYWARDAHAKGRIVTLGRAAVTPGAFLLRLAANGECGHIVISDGQGGTVEAACTRLGVIAGTVHHRRWDLGILVPGVEYHLSGTPANVQPAAGMIYRLTEPRLQGVTIRRLQYRLRDLGYLQEPADGIYGPATMQAVEAFQQAYHLVADGEAGPVTIKELGVQA